MHTTTLGVGEVVKHAYNEGVRYFIIGCGDSATCDLGIGFASALGIKFADRYGDVVPPFGKHLREIKRIERDSLAERIAAECSIEVACNPNSLLCGSGGTALRYGPQKGASEKETRLLHKGIEALTGLLEEDCNDHLGYIPGAGGAGGLAGGIYALFGGKLTYSFDVVRRYVQLDEKFSAADLVITAEGHLDANTMTGKLPVSVALYSKRFNKPVIVIAGGVADDMRIAYHNGIDSIEVVTKRPCSMDIAMHLVDEWLPSAAERVWRKMELGKALASK
jgi:glycerate kinase